MNKTKTKIISEMSPKNSMDDISIAAESEWELRPGGMLVQKRNPDSDRAVVPPPTIRVRVKHNSIYHEIYINSQASFGELKKMLSAPTGLHPDDQKLLFKDKERDSKAYLDVVGVKDRSKIVVMEDPMRQERRFLEMRKNAKFEKAAKSVSEITLEVDKLATKVAALDSAISKGVKVADTEVLNLIELLMTQLIKLDGIIADGDIKIQRRLQVKRVQKYVETLDLLKIKNAEPRSNGSQNPLQQQQQQQKAAQPRHSTGTIPTAAPQPRQQPAAAPQQPHQPTSRRSVKPIPTTPAVVSTRWETFDNSSAGFVPYPSTSKTNNGNTTQSNKLNWEFFD
ncbi:hypothetical protein C5167_006338 [Papaver somniferum]|uniref:BAG domain-containing protein n=1 Tax=Papaver somniferum TaxID=3469 RepID=A0A4Y7JG89_PAPSO|nr:BAG family molecular chaperone regulator 3-like [Papaver somniferum]RZC59030.1 hypothetical protein C5167_006338 [Papaver somniferum]